MASLSPAGSWLNTMTDKFVDPSITSYLGTTLYSSSILIINRWSFVHLFAGMLFYLWKPNNLKLWIKIVLGFEVVEYMLAGLGSHPLYVEKAVDVFWDIILGIGGFLLLRYIKTGRKDFKQ